MTTKIKWRLSKLPDSHEVSLLVEKGILTKDEAREILFSLETVEERDKKSLQDEIKFLREVVASMARAGHVSITHTIKNVPNEQMPWQVQPWYQPYQTWCTATDTANTTANFGSGTQLLSMTGNASTTLYSYDSPQSLTDQLPDFTSIQTF